LKDFRIEFRINQREATRRTNKKEEPLDYPPLVSNGAVLEYLVSRAEGQHTLVVDKEELKGSGLSYKIPIPIS